MLIFNMRVGPVRLKMPNMQKKNNSEMSSQIIPNFHLFSSWKSESKGINADEIFLHVCYTDKSESKRAIVNACYLYESLLKKII